MPIAARYMMWSRHLVALLLLLSSLSGSAQEESLVQEDKEENGGGNEGGTAELFGDDYIHPWNYCDEDGWWGSHLCGLGWYCPFDGPSPDETGCSRCPDASAGERCKDMGLSPEGMDDCIKWCEDPGIAGDPCSSDSPCAFGVHFCDFASADGDGGTCRECPADLSECDAEGEGALSEMGKQDCVSCKLDCSEMDVTYMSVMKPGGRNGNFEVKTSSIWNVDKEPSMSASGPLIECSDLILQDVEKCPGADGHVCLIEDYTRDTMNWEVSRKAEANGCVAIALYGLYDDADSISAGQHLGVNLAIPFVFISYNDGKRLVREELGSIANVTIQAYGQWCFKNRKCSDTVPCMGEYAGGYCDYNSKVVDGEFVEGYCTDCPTDEDGNPDPLACFFDRSTKDISRNPEMVESCASNCAASMKFGNCKFCPEDVTGFEFGVETESDRCSFCPHDDVQYPDREFPLFGEEVTCWQMQAFFERLDVHRDSLNCRLAHVTNYICGCQGTGYGGADSETKKAVLAWLPRTMALLSLMGSSFIVFDSVREKKNRGKTFNQLMLALSVFDIFGSCAYALTTLPMPASDYIYGAHGTEATCTAQGFFIQLGTVACFLNVSLAVYYLLVIKHGWSEQRIKSRRKWLFAPPVLVGLGFAFAGIPFYDNMILWCNNAAPWWPDIPVTVAIFAATCIMITVCWDVYQKEKASAKWRSGGANSLSQKVFWQCFWYLMAFYLTWAPYLALQFMWSSGKAFSMYGFTLFSGTMVPLQGLWNFFIYIRPRYLKRLRSSISAKLSSGSSLVKGRIMSRLPVSKTTKTPLPENGSEARQPGSASQKNSQAQPSTTASSPTQSDTSHGIKGDEVDSSQVASRELNIAGREGTHAHDV